MQEARAVTSRRRHAQRVTQMYADGLNQRSFSSVLPDVVEHRDVIARLDSLQMRDDERFDRLVPAERLERLVVAIDFQPAPSAASVCSGRLPSRLKSSSSNLVLSFDSCTLGWSKGLMPITAPAIAVAISQM